ncbi:MAG: cohesin domain-containing protein, partial [bacterium]|nr:cohesin domain-containing protein [bacterium]
MSKKTILILTTVFIMVLTSWSFAQVDVTIPNQSGEHGQTVIIPVNVSDLTGLEIISYQFTVEFDENVLDATGVTTSGTLSETAGWSVLPNTSNDGKIIVGGFGFSELSGSGALIKLNFNVVGNPTQTTSLTFSDFVFNDGNPAVNTNGGVFTVTGTLINITVTTNIGAGTKVVVDGVQRNAPYSAQWYANTSHTISVDPEQSGGNGVKYIYNSWSHGGSRSQTVTPTSSTTYTANLDIKYYLTVDSDHDSPQGEGWYNSGVSASFSVTTPTEQSGGSRYRFTNWSGDYSGTNPSGSVAMNGPKTVIANWQRQYFLSTAENPSIGGNVSPATPGEWYDSGTYAQLDATVSSGYQWAGWTGDLTESTKPTQILMNGPKSVTANFDKLIEITVQTVPSGLQFSADGQTYTSPKIFTWVENSQHTLSVASPQSGATGVRYTFSSWSDGGPQSHTYVVPGSNQTVTANFTTQYYLTVTSSRDNPQGQGWYNSGSTANFSVSSPADESNGTRYVFTQWSGAYSGSSTSGSVVMSGPKEVIANWQTQYFLSTAENPSQGGDITPAVPGAWYNSGTNAQLNATEASGYQWAGWSGDLSGMTRPTQLLMNSPKGVTANFGRLVEITIQTVPSGRQFVVDGQTYSSTQVFNWLENGQHTLSVASPQSGATGVRYIFSSWSDGGSQSHTYVVPGSNQTVTANFTTQYYLTVTSSRDNPQGSGWYNSASTANFSVSSPADESNGTR